MTACCRSGTAPRLRTAGFHYRVDAARSAHSEIPARAVLVFDGVFLLRPDFYLPGQALNR